MRFRTCIRNNVLSELGLSLYFISSHAVARCLTINSQVIVIDIIYIGISETRDIGLGIMRVAQIPHEAVF